MPNCRELSPHCKCHISTVRSSRPVGQNMERKLKRWRKGPHFDMGALKASCPHTAGQCFLTGFLKPDCEESISLDGPHLVLYRQLQWEGKLVTRKV